MNIFKPTTPQGGVLMGIMVAAFYGFYPPCLHIVYGMGASASFVALVVVWVRAMGLTGHCLLHRKPMFQTRDDIRQGLIGGFFQAISSGFTMLALHYLQGSLVVIILYTHTLMLMFYIIWRGEMAFNRNVLILTLVALIGLTLVLDVWNVTSATNLWGVLFSFIGAAAIVPRLYVYGTQTRDRDPAVVGAENFLIAAILTLPIIFIEMPVLPLQWAGYAWLLLGAVTLAAGTFYTFYGISIMGSFSWSLLQKLQPVYTALFSAFLIGEVLKWHQYFGMVLVMGCLTVYHFMKNRAKLNPLVDEND